MARGPVTVPQPAKRFPFVRGTWPPQPKPMYAQQEQPTTRIEPKQGQRDYGKRPNPAGNTGLTGMS